MAISFAAGEDTLVERVNRELQNYIFVGRYTVTIDTDVDDATIVQLPHRDIIESSVEVTVDGVSVTVDVNGQAGYISFASPLANGSVVVVTYNYSYWSEQLIKDTINAGVEFLFPSFYRNSIDTSLTSDGTSTEYQAPAGTEIVKSIDVQGQGGSGYRTIKRHRWVSLFDGDSLSIKFDSPPPAGAMRLHTVRRVNAFTYDDDLLSDIGLPERAAPVIVYYACWRLLSSIAARRTRLDTAFTTQSGQQLSPRQIMDAANGYQMACQVEMAQRKMPPWGSR